MLQLVTFGELSNDVDTTGKVSICVVASKVAITRLSSVVLESNIDVNLLHGKAFGPGITN
jgi:hypothetical protein